jgi:hypothetical protein
MVTTFRHFLNPFSEATLDEKVLRPSVSTHTYACLSVDICPSRNWWQIRLGSGHAWNFELRDNELQRIHINTFIWCGHWYSHLIFCSCIILYFCYLNFFVSLGFLSVRRLKALIMCEKSDARSDAARNRPILVLQLGSHQRHLKTLQHKYGSNRAVSVGKCQSPPHSALSGSIDRQVVL